jgi:hypothetical protein
MRSLPINKTLLMPVQFIKPQPQPQAAEKTYHETAD